MSHDNKLRQLRPESTFANFEVYHEGQQQVVNIFQSMAQQLIDFAAEIAGKEYPFPFGQVIFLHSEPGHGKSHLLEALANAVLAGAPKLARSIYLDRGRFTLTHIAGCSTYDQCPIVLIDDLFAEYQSMSQLHRATDVPCLLNFLASVYERRTLVIATSNFSMMENGGILQRIAEVDKVGRILSRCKELLSTAGELYLPGHDYREDIAARRKGDAAARMLKLRLPTSTD